jgi:hypothetical protein
MTHHNHQLTIRLEKKILSQFIAYSRRHGTTMSVIIRKLINQVLDNAKTGQGNLVH